MSILLLSLKASLLAFRFKSEAKLASSIFKGDQGTKILASNMAARNTTKATEAIPAKTGSESFFTTIPEQRPKAPPKRISLIVSAEDILNCFESRPNSANQLLFTNRFPLKFRAKTREQRENGAIDVVRSFI